MTLCDELVQISGDAAVMKKALNQIASRLHDKPSRSQHLLTSAVPGVYAAGGSLISPAGGAPILGIAPLVGPYGGYKGDTGDWSRSLHSAPRDEISSKEFSVRLVCPTGNIGGVIGKGGVIINQIRQESGATIQVDSSATEGDECLTTKELGSRAYGSSSLGWSNPARFPMMVVMLLLCASVMHAAVPIPNGTAAVDMLSPEFYKDSCPQLRDIAYRVILTSIQTDPRISANLMKLHFSDCFVKGCDASVLLADTAKIDSERDAEPNMYILRGFTVVNEIKKAVEATCPATVSCADILAISAEIASVVVGGPTWQVPLGRRDSLKAYKKLVNRNYPGLTFTLDELKAAFAVKGLTSVDLVALSGAHTFGRAHCSSFKHRLYNLSGTPVYTGPNMDSTYLRSLRTLCPQDGGDDYEAYLDIYSPDEFDNGYYKSLIAQHGTLQTDQELFSSADVDTAGLVSMFSNDQRLFFDQFAASMIKMSRVGVLTGSDGEIRRQCNLVNGGTRLHFSWVWSFFTLLCIIFL